MEGGGAEGAGGWDGGPGWEPQGGGEGAGYGGEAYGEYGRPVAEPDGERRRALLWALAIVAVVALAIVLGSRYGPSARAAGACAGEDEGTERDECLLATARATGDIVGCQAISRGLRDRCLAAAAAASADPLACGGVADEGWRARCLAAATGDAAPCDALADMATAERCRRDAGARASPSATGDDAPPPGNATGAQATPSSAESPAMNDTSESVSPSPSAS